MLYKEIDEWVGNSLFLLYFIIIYPFLYVRCNNRLHQKYGPVRCLNAHVRISFFLCGSESRPVGQTLVALARVYEGQGETDQAAAIYQRLATEFPVAPTEAAKLHRRLGLLYYTTGRYHAALDEFQTTARLRRLATKSFPYHVQKDLHAIGQTYERIENMQEALKAYREAVSYLREQGLSEAWESAKSLLLVACLYESTNRPHEAITTLRKALRVYILNEGDFPRRASVARVYERLGNLLWSQKQVADAVKEYRLALDVYRRGGRSDEDPEVSSILRKIEDMNVLV